ncbi:MAG TPA: DUF1080 domain-containing protein [Paludibaculum sp.]|jgi:hypothetical protein
MRTVLLLVSAASLVFAQAPNTLTPAEKAAGWQLLFDGQSMKGWQPTAAGTWAIEDGCLKSLSKPVLREDLISNAAFGDFELTFEWKVAPGSNSGVKYRIQDAVLVDDHQLPNKMPFEQQVAYFLKTRSAKKELVQAGSDAQVYPVAFEYQVIDDAKHPDAIRNASSRAGALYRMAAPTEAAAKPVGEFNQGRIVLRGKHVQHYLNGIKVVEIDLDAPQVRASIEQRWAAGNPVRDLLENMPKAMTPVAIQHHNDVAWYRNVKIRPLAAAK